MQNNNEEPLMTFPSKEAADKYAKEHVYAFAHCTIPGEWILMCALPGGMYAVAACGTKAVFQPNW